MIFWEISFRKISRNFDKYNKSEQKPWKILAKEYIFGKVADPQPATLSKKLNIITGIFQVISLHLWSPSFKVDFKEKTLNLNGFE